MNGANGYGRRLLHITPGNICNNHIYIRDHYDFFPPDCVGLSKRAKGIGSHDIELVLDGLDEVVKTDIGANPKNGKPRLV